ncbi:hypothetical protein [Halocola ammonii]
MNWFKLNKVIFLLALLPMGTSAQAYENISRNKDIVLETVEPRKFQSWELTSNSELLAHPQDNMRTALANATAQRDHQLASNQPLSGNDSIAVSDTTIMEIPAFRSSSLTLKPRVGLGFGTLTFFGDVGSNEDGYSIANSNLAYTISVTNEFNPYFDLRLYAMFGQIAVNERSTERRLNFNSEVRAGGAAISYNFSHWLPQRSFLEPFVSVGIETFEYNSKTDLKDADGNYYHYWSDGTIRNMPEGAPTAGEADIIQRDYTYETDLREMDLDGMGKYPLRNWSVPVGLGVNLNVTERFEVRLASTYHFTFTDMIDNVSDAGEGQRKGNARNDQFFYNSISLNYDLNITPTKKEIPKVFEEFGVETGPVAQVDMDGDKDGIHDFEDLCLNTPLGAAVDNNGCAIDTDEDGVPDYMDMEAETALNAPVDKDGVTVTDEEFYQRYLFWHDSLSVKENFARIHADKKDIPEYYALKVGSDGEGLSQTEINQVLAMNDARSFKYDGETMYLVGDYKNLSDAISRKLALESTGLKAEVMRGSKAGIASIQETADRAESQLAESMKTDSVLNSLENENASINTEQVIYRVQIGAYKNGISGDVFANVPELFEVKGQDGIVRYSSGTFTNVKDAAERKVDLLVDGFDGAFIAAYKNGERVTLASTGVNVSEGAKDEIVDRAVNAVNPENVYFRVQLGAYEEDIPTKVLDQFFKIGNVKPMNFGDGIIRYMTTQFDTWPEAKAILKKAIAAGIDDAFIVGDFNGKFISEEDARLLESGEISTVDNN